MKYILRVWLVAFLIVSQSSALGLAQGLPVAKPDQVGLSGERLSRIDKLVQSYVNENRVAGTVSLVARRGKIAYLNTSGVADLSDKRPMRVDTIFRIASMTKPVTTVAAMILYEEGRLLLSDPVAKYIPEFSNAQVLAPNSTRSGEGYTTVPSKAPITVRHLLTHTSGLIYRFLNGEPLGSIYHKAGISDGLSETDGTIGDMAKKLAKLPLKHQPGEAWEYSLSTDVLGRVVEVASGMTLDQFFQERIFKPLGMKDTHFYLPEEKLPRLAAVHTASKAAGLQKVEGVVESGHLLFSSTYPYKGPRSYFSGGAGLSSTAPDYIRFLQMLLNGGELDGIRILSRKSVELMTTNHIGNLDVFRTLPGYKFGLGFAILTDLGASGAIGSVGEYNWGGFFYTRFWVDPREKLIGLMMTQTYPNFQLDLFDRFRVLAYQAISD